MNIEDEINEHLDGMDSRPSSHWTDLKPRRRLLPWGRWKVLTRLWLERKAAQRMEVIQARKRSMDMARGLSRGRALR